MHLIIDGTGAYIALGDNTLAATGGQVLVVLLRSEQAAAASALARVAPARDAFLAAVRARGQAEDVAQLAALDAAIGPALAALTAAQQAAVQAGADLADAAQGLLAAHDRAQQAAADQYGEQGQVWWDGAGFQARQKAVDPAETRLLAEAQQLVDRAAANPDLALALRAMFGVDPTDLTAVIGAMRARRLG